MIGTYKKIRGFNMKELSSLVKSYKPIAEHKEDLVIDEFAKSIIDRVFSSMADIFPAWKHNWKSDDPSDPDKVLRRVKLEWTKAFVENNITTLEQISAGFTKARSAETDFLPSCGKFIAWCKPSPESMGWPSTLKALKDCIAYKANQKLFFPVELNSRALIIDLCKRVDWWLMNAAQSQQQIKKADDHFESEYMAMITSGYAEPDVTLAPRLPTEHAVKENMSDEQKADKRVRGLDAIRAIKAKMKGK